MNREQYFELVQDAIEAIGHVLDQPPPRPRESWHYLNALHELEYELDAETNEIEARNGVRHAQAD